MRLPLLVSSLSALLLALAPAAAAQDTAQVLKDFKAANKQTLADFKGAVKDATAALGVSFDEFSSRFDELSGSDAPVEDLVIALMAFQITVWNAELAAVTALDAAAAEAVSEVQTGGADENVLPTGLVVGDGGALDQAVAALDAIAGKSVTAPRKQLAKLAKKLRGQTDMRLSVVLSPQRPFVVAPQSGSAGSGPQNSLTIDLLLGFDRGGVSDDARFWVSGGGFSDAGDVSLLVQGPALLTTLPGTPNDLTGRWLIDIASPASPVAEGNYFFVASQNATSIACAALGVE
jgi:hypothetical protein